MKRILEETGISFIENEPLSRHTSFRVGGPARYFVRPSSVRDLSELLSKLRESGKPHFVMGNGTNLLAPDEGFDGVVISIGEGMSGIELADKTTITAGAGALMSAVGRFAMGCSLTGFEFAHGIPGSIGGGVYMNAGAYGGELKDVVRRVFYLDETLATRSMIGDEAGFAYRESLFKHNKYIITGAEIRLSHGDSHEILSRMEELAKKRRDKQPLDFPSAGSTFKRPEGHFAAKLIEDCGLKGRRVGGAAVSEKHAGFIINIGGATCSDILKLMDLVREEVLRAFDIELQPEVELIGQTK